MSWRVELNMKWQAQHVVRLCSPLPLLSTHISVERIAALRNRHQIEAARASVNVVGLIMQNPASMRDWSNGVKMVTRGIKMHSIQPLHSHLVVCHGRKLKLGGILEGPAAVGAIISDINNLQD